jgi:pimeloyl-ACP methyl ester carboxylesterase
VRSGGVRVAVREFGGRGPDLVLVHGLGRTLVDWTAAASLLTARHRVVAFDVRCHGASGDGPWTWGAVLDDLAAVAAGCGMANPAVAGHSLGGMIAVMWAERRPACPGVVNLDGHGASRPQQEHREAGQRAADVASSGPEPDDQAIVERGHGRGVGGGQGRLDVRELVIHLGSSSLRRGAAEKPRRICVAHAPHSRRHLLRSSLRVRRVRSLRCSSVPCAWGTWTPHLSPRLPSAPLGRFCKDDERRGRHLDSPGGRRWVGA